MIQLCSNPQNALKTLTSSLYLLACGAWRSLWASDCDLPFWICLWFPEQPMKLRPNGSTRHDPPVEPRTTWVHLCMMLHETSAQGLAGFLLSQRHREFTTKCVSFTFCLVVVVVVVVVLLLCSGSSPMFGPFMVWWAFSGFSLTGQCESLCMGIKKNKKNIVCAAWERLRVFTSQTYHLLASVWWEQLGSCEVQLVTFDLETKQENKLERKKKLACTTEEWNISTL